jgi:acetyl esterase/lipase
MSTQEILLWPDTAPGSEKLSLAEQITERSTDTSVFDRAITSIMRPSLTVMRPEHPNGLAILIAPGGGYQRVVLDREGLEIGEWLNSLGITAFLLKYRLPAEGHDNGRDVPLQDAQRAMRLIRANAVRFGISPSRVGAMGFSAGGHVIASLGTRFNAKVCEAIDAPDTNSARPDFMVLAYPVVTMTKEYGHAGSRDALLGPEASDVMAKAYSNEFLVTAQTPPTLIVLPNDDASVPPENSVNFYLGLRRAGVKAEMHIYQQGGHGFGIRLAKGPVRGWTQACEDWLRLNGWL